MIGIIASVALQAAMVAPCYYTGRNRQWIYAIVFLPVAGSIAYLLMEVVPGFFGGITGQRAMRKVRRTLDPQGETRRRSLELERSENVDTRRRLAEEHLENGRFAEAEKLYAESLGGIFADDPVLMLGRAHALFGMGEHARVVETLDELIRTNPEFRSQDGHLLYARALERLGEYERAREEYTALCAYYAGAEARCRFALMLLEQGDDAAAREHFETILRDARLAPRHYRRNNAKWIAIAQRGGPGE